MPDRVGSQDAPPAGVTFNTRDSVYQDLLARVIQSNARVVPFVGAGLSVFGRDDERLPLWRELIERLIGEGRALGLVDTEDAAPIYEALARGQFIRATDRILHLLGEPTFRRVVQRELDDTDRPVPPAVTALVAISWSLIVTTNLDRFIARAYLNRYGSPINAVPGIDTHRLVAALAGIEKSANTTLAQIHGDIDLYPSWRLTSRHYQQVLQDPGYTEALKHLFLRQLFFVGFGLQDDDFDLLLGTIGRIYPAGAGEFFALLPRSKVADPRIRELVRVNGLRPIFYDIEDSGPDDPFGGHRAVYECLQHLARVWASATLELPFTLKYFPELDANFVGRDDDIARLKDLLLRERASAVQIVGLGGVGKTSLVQQFLEYSRLEIAEAGFERIFGCSFHRAEVGEFVQDLELACLGPSTLSLPEKVSRICEHLRHHRLLLVLDGVENLLDDDLALRNRYLMEVLRGVSAGDGAVLTTTRIPIKGLPDVFGDELDLGPLSPAQMDQFLALWGLDRLPAPTRAKLRDVTGGHPLALRVLAGVLRAVPTSQAVDAIATDAILAVPDELDPLRENQLARVLRSYLSLLSREELDFMRSWSVFDRPASFPLVESVIGHDYAAPTASQRLTGVDLRPVVTSLLEKRLLALGPSGELTSHPTVREFFGALAREARQDVRPLHRRLAAHFLSTAETLPDSFEGIVPLLAACRHAAAYEDWSLFHDVFFRRVMRDWLCFLCDSLGGWDEALNIAQLVPSPDSSGFPQDLDALYYPAIIARSLKHLGRTDESLMKYVECFRTAARTEHPETAMHINNLLTMLVWRGDLAAAEALVEPNLLALSWIREEWRLRWQVDHGLSSIAYLRLLEGDWTTGSELYELSDHAWDGFPGGPVRIFDYYPLYRSELFLRGERPDHEQALGYLHRLQDVATQERWPEPICRGHIQLAEVHRSYAHVSASPNANLAEAKRHLDAASALPAGMVVTDVAIAYMLGRVKLEVDNRRLRGHSSLSDYDLGDLLKRVERLADDSRLLLALPEVIAGRGHVRLLNSDRVGASAALAKSLDVCTRQGNMLYPTSPRSLVGYLRKLLYVEGHDESAVTMAKPTEFIGRRLEPDDLLAAMKNVSSMTSVRGEGR